MTIYTEAVDDGAGFAYGFDYLIRIGFLLFNDEVLSNIVRFGERNDSIIHRSIIHSNS